MSNYVKSTDFASKDALASGNAAKIVKGTEIDTEFNNIATAIATKADTVSPTFTGTPSLPTGATAVTQSTADSSTKLATTAFVQAVFATIYPVGSVYTNASVSTNPATLLGFGTWTAFGAGRVMVGFDSGNALFDAAEETGGSADAVVVSHTHEFSATTSTAGSHIHTVNYGNANSSATNMVNGDADNNTLIGTKNTNSAGDHSHTVSGTTSSTGSSATNANYQPYITVYMWKRTA